MFWSLRMKPTELQMSLRIIRKAVQSWSTPVVTEISYQLDPFKVLVSCILSLRTRDTNTDAASKNLFELADTPQKILQLDKKCVEKAIYPVAFYRKKTTRLYQICETLINCHQGTVPNTLEELLKLKGVGRKTANLTLTLGYRKLGICVDTHVHRISNRWGYVKTEHLNETEKTLRNQLPKRYWIEFNNLLVSFGQNICKPRSPYCSQCCVVKYCRQVGVTGSR